MKIDDLVKSVLTESVNPQLVVLNIDDNHDYYEGARDALKQIGFKDQGTAFEFLKRIKGQEVKDLEYFKNFAVFSPTKPSPAEVKAALKKK